ncbi:MAG TPA: Rrf2 family transcriptional regulator [Thermoanaerobaculia bacterium]|nr:Rrf2 family transcriptional regulator [Thermoanaerobaculia bacterium]
MSGIVKFSEAASIALHTMTVLAAAPERHVTVHEIAERMPVSESHLAKVLQRLAKAGLVDSARGPQGGFMLRGDPQQITLLRVYEAIEGRLDVAYCMFPERTDCASCILEDTLRSANQIVHDRLARTALSALVTAFRPRVDTVMLGPARRGAQHPPARPRGRA